MIRYHIDAQYNSDFNEIRVTEHGFGSFFYSSKTRDTLRRVIRACAGRDREHIIRFAPNLFDNGVKDYVLPRTTNQGRMRGIEDAN